MIERHISRSLVIIAMRVSILACKFGLALFIGRYLDLASLGLFGLAAGAVAVAPVLIALGVVNLVMRDIVTVAALERVDHLRHYWCVVVSAYGFALLAAFVLTAVFDLTHLWILVLLLTLFEHLGNDVFQLQSNLERPLSANVNAFLRGAAWVLVYVPLALWIPSLRSLSILLIFWIAGSVSAFLLFIWTSRAWPWKAVFARPFRLDWLALTIRRAFVIYVSDVGFITSQYVDRYLVTLFLGLEFAGVYFLYWAFANAASTLVSLTVLHVQRPLLIRAHHRGGPPLHRQVALGFARTTALASLAFSGLVGLGFHVLLPFLDHQLLGDYLPAFWLMMAAMTVRNMADFGAISLFTAHRDALMTITNVSAIGLLVLTQVLLLPVAGLYGAAAAMLVSFGVVGLWRFRAVFGRWSAAVTPFRLIAGRPARRRREIAPSG